MGIAIFVVAWAVATRSPRRRILLAAVALASFVLSALGLWKAVVGVAIDLVLLAVVWVMRVRPAAITAGRGSPVVRSRAA